MIKKDIKSDKTIFLIDGSSFLYRAYYSLPPLHDIHGQPVQIVYGFCRMMKKLINEFNPAYCAVIWDPGRQVPTVRHELSKEYKAQRQSSPLDLTEQKKLVKEFLSTIALHQEEAAGIEADDILYSRAQDFTHKDYHVVLVTSDKDMRQCVSEKTVIFDPFKEEVIDVATVEKRYGIPVSKLAFYFALVGDATDNIPGVAGIGPKTAQGLVNTYASLADLYNRLETVEKERTRLLLQKSREDAFLSEKLFTLYYYPAPAVIQDYAFNQDNWYKARDFFKRFSFTSLLKGFPPEDPSTVTPTNPPNGRFVAITTKAELEEVCALINTHKRCAIDTETTGLDPLKAELVGISLCVELGTAYYIPLRHKHTPVQLEQEVVVSMLGPLLADASIKKYLHHTKFDQLALSRAGIALEGVAFDTLIAAHLISKEGQRISLKTLSAVYLNQTMLTFEEVVTKQRLKNFSEVPLDRATIYAAADAHQTMALVALLQAELEKNEQNPLFYDIEVPLINVLYKMEKQGITIDVHVLDQLESQVASDLKTLEAQIQTLLPEGWSAINLNSPRQLEELLFTVLKLTPLKKTTQKTGYSTDHTVLSELAKVHPIPALILKHRELYKIKSTYLDALKAYINPYTGKIHTSFSQTSTATGRLASYEPNLQNIPTGVAAGSFPIRSAFKPQEEHVFMSADYSQIELRVLAYLSQDERLINAFVTGQDIHTETAAHLFDTTPDKVFPEQRALAKRINFSILYGLSPYGLSQDLDIPYKNAQHYIEKYFAQYPGVVLWMNNVVEQAKQNGFVQTLWGRRRYCPRH